ncbi:MAG: trehalose-phosphatase [Gemmatimonadetes bacterium]|nr:trehalose-phosphatase [Gemmatimonadota bacterium]
MGRKSYSGATLAPAERAAEPVAAGTGRVGTARRRPAAGGLRRPRHACHRDRRAAVGPIARDPGGPAPAPSRSPVHDRADAPPNALAHWPGLAATLRGRRLAVFLDYDGTLTPIVDRPDLAVLSEDMRETLRRLAATWPTAVVSGRARDDVAARVGVDALNYAGVHGFDIVGPDAAGPHLEVKPGLAPAVARVAEELRRRTAGIPGVLVEDKRFAAAVHYRLVPEARVPEVERIVDDVLARHPELRKALGKKVFELRPAIDWDKGRAVRWILSALGLDRPDVVPLYVGDDVTDEDAFRALRDHGVGLLVADTPRPTAASYSLRDVGEVREFLERLVGLGATTSR